MFGEYINSFILNSLESVITWFETFRLRTEKALNGENDTERGTNSVLNRAYILLALLVTLLYTLLLLIGGVLSIVVSILPLDGKIGFKNVQPKNIKLLFANLEWRLISPVCAICIVAFVALSVLSHNNYAREQNSPYYDFRKDLNDDIREFTWDHKLSPRNEVHSVLLSSVDVTEDNITVRDLKKTCCNGKYQNINFSSVYDFFVYLFYVGDNDNLAKCLEKELDYGYSSDKRLFTRDILAPACEDAFASARFCESKLYLKHIFTNCGWSSISDYPNYNNSFYLLRMFLENIEDRYTWTFMWGYEYENAYLEGFIYDRDEAFSRWGTSTYKAYVTENMGDISHYLNAVYLFQKKEYDEADEAFSMLVEKTASDIIRQYSAYMVIRNAYYKWNESNDEQEAQVNKVSLEKRIEEFASQIKIKYLSNTLSDYTDYQI